MKASVEFLLHFYFNSKLYFNKRNSLTTHGRLCGTEEKINTYHFQIVTMFSNKQMLSHKTEI